MWLTEGDRDRPKAFGGRTAMDCWLEPVWMEAGTTHTLNLHFDWTRKNVTKDWSATAWGENGEVKVEHNDGI